MSDYEVSYSFGRVSVTIKSSDPEFVEKWWKIFNEETDPKPVPYHKKNHLLTSDP